MYSLIRPFRTDLRGSVWCRGRSRWRGGVQFAGDALRYALVRPGRVVVHLVFDQDGAKV